MKNKKHVTQLMLFVSAANNTAAYKILCDDEIFSDHIPSPVDFIEDLQDFVDNKGFDFENCIVILQTDAASVNREYLNQLAVSFIQSCDRVSILQMSYQELLQNPLLNLPVAQYCMNFFHLYLNAVRYIKTISETSSFSS